MGFQTLFDFEKALSAYTGAPYVIVTDCCTHAIELCMRYDNVSECEFTPWTYISVPMIMHRLNIKYGYHDHAWQRWIGEYTFVGTRIWDSARRLERDMYRSGTMQCLSFGNTKPLHLGRAGAILTDDQDAYRWLSRARSDGRDLSIQPWTAQGDFKPGWHYCPTLEICARGLELLEGFTGQCQDVEYNDCRDISIV